MECEISLVRYMHDMKKLANVKNKDHECVYAYDSTEWLKTWTMY